MAGKTSHRVFAGSALQELFSIFFVANSLDNGCLSSRTRFVKMFQRFVVRCPIRFDSKICDRAKMASSDIRGVDVTKITFDFFVANSLSRFSPKTIGCPNVLEIRGAIPDTFDSKKYDRRYKNYFRLFCCK